LNRTQRDDSPNNIKQNGILFCFLDAPHDGWPAVSGTLEHRAEDPADADVFGLLKAAHCSLLHNAHKFPANKIITRRSQILCDKTSLVDAPKIPRNKNNYSQSSIILHNKKKL
jgi:hypothetical protein